MFANVIFNKQSLVDMPGHGDEASAPEGAPPAAEQVPAQADAQPGMLAQAFGVDGPIDPAVWGAYADSLPRPTSAVGVWFLGGDGGQDVLVVGGDRYTLDQLRLHGCLSQSDVELMGYVGRYMRGAAGAAQRLGGQDTPRADEGGDMPASQAGLVNTAELPDLPGIPDDGEYGGDELPYGHPDDDEEGAAAEGFGIVNDGTDEAAVDVEAMWTTNPAALWRARTRVRLVKQLETSGALESALKDLQRQVKRDQRQAALERELARQRKLVARLAAVLTLMADGAESQAASVHCADAADTSWLMRWADADPWGRQLVSHARDAVARVRS